ncbi:hypothetical protein EJ06DRAFT_526059 [Trichodelitschia bisporula]|uniref:Small ribosomal subunit protein mS41 n=1 Tax=Trichodelitschia bisporula TaxID=703511 RepID=A0A6G1IB73_9PEZI|nr:hypothetical protein EJ06DRAFT_526059 [Trichodelitschia bisporula]
MLLRWPLRLFTPTTPHRTLTTLTKREARPIPPPTPFVPNTETFLTLIGRGMKQHAPKIPSWEALFRFTSTQFKNLGIEPARNRKYLLNWRERFRNGAYGIGGDLTEVQEGVGEIKVFEVPVPGRRRATATRTPGTKKVVLNVPPGAERPTVPLEEATPVRVVKLTGAQTISGPYVEPIKGTSGLRAKIAVREGLWEVKRGKKVDGGERRKAEVRSKRRAEERKAQRA